MVSTKILSSTTVFNIHYNKKCFLSSKLAYDDDLKDRDTEDSNDC